MSAISGGTARSRSRGGGETSPRDDDPRVVRTRAAAVDAAKTLFLQKGYAGTTMEEIAALAGIAKRTLYNNYADKEALFTQIVAEVIDHAEAFARALPDHFTADVTASGLPAALHDLGRRLALGVVRPDVVALRRLLVGEARAFPELARAYFDRAPGRVIVALASAFEHLGTLGLLRTTDVRRAASQFAYLVVGEPLDRAILLGATPSREHLLDTAREGVDTFLARYGTAPLGGPLHPTPTPATPCASRTSSDS
jgi:TetR/AcrR family transcriptional repressor of mexJK operon